MPMYKIPTVSSETKSIPDKEIPLKKVSIKIPTPGTEELITLITNILKNKKVTYLWLGPDELSYDYVLPEGVDEILEWFQSSIKGD